MMGGAGSSRRGLPERVRVIRGAHVMGDLKQQVGKAKAGVGEV